MRLYNTLTRSVEEFRPLDSQGKRVGIYVCGPTVYDVPHIGHARSAFVFDVLRRYLEFRDYQVTFARNVTDVDDKIIEKARQELGTRGMGHGTGDLKSKCAEVAEKYLKSYHDMMDRLGIRQPTLEPKATEHVVPDMTDCISKLLITGVAYEAKGDVYFAVRKFPSYGHLSNRTLDELQAGARVEPEEHPGPPTTLAGAGKQDPLDFALWKASKPGEPTWTSPWGPGRPGWHIECSTMSTKYLGEAFDIHGGGVDLVFPHHENEIAQAKAAGKPFARYWVHNGLLTVNGEKMSKSLGNYLTVEQALADYPHPDYLKLFFLKTHYRSPIDYSTAKMDEARKNWNEFAEFFQHYYQRYAENSAPLGRVTLGGEAKQRFEDAMDDDLNTPAALAVLFDLVNLGKGALLSPRPQPGASRSVHDTLVGCLGTLGLFQQGLTEEAPETARRVQAMIAERDAARKAKDFKRADDIRQTLRQEGVVLADTASGTLWRRAR